MANSIGDIANTVAAYMCQSRSVFVVNGVDLILVALNNARRKAERDHDFIMQQCTATLSVDPVNGAALSGATLPTGFSRIKAIDTIYVQDPNDSNILFPLALDPKRLIATRYRQRNYRWRQSVTGPWRYPADWQISQNQNFPQTRVFWQNDTLFLTPQPQMTMGCTLDVNAWMIDYKSNTSVSVSVSSTASTSVTLTSAAPSDLVTGSRLLGQLVVTATGTAVTLAGNANQTIAAPTVVPYSNMPSVTNNEDYQDWMVENGGDYLQWAATIEVNYLQQRFVARQDGYIDPPTQMRDAALASLVLWDDTQFELGRQPFINR